MKRPWMYFAMTLALVGLALVAGLVAGRSERNATNRPPSVSARGSAPAAVADDATNTTTSADGKPLVGRLIGYVDTDGYLVEEDANGAAAITASFSSNDPNDTPADSTRRAELRATDEQLAEAGLDAAFFARAAASAATPRTADGRPALGRSAVAPGVFRKLLADRAAGEALAESEKAFLDLYDLIPAAPIASPPSAEALSRDLEARGLMATAFDGGTLDMLRRLDHPALIPVALDPAEARAASTAAARAPSGIATPTPATAVPEAHRRWLALTGFDGDRIWLAGLVANRVVSVAQAELAPHWLEAGIIVWKNHEDLASRVERGASASSIRWLQTALAELRYFDGPANGLFDARTADALRDFQSTNGLTEDGVVGPLTQIALYAQLDRYPVPRLSLGSVRPAPPPLGALTFPGSDAANPPASSLPSSSSAPSASPPTASATISGSPTASLPVGSSSSLSALISSLTPAPASAIPPMAAASSRPATPPGVTPPPAVSAPPPAAAQPSSQPHGDRG
jgi:peptidoglycan hydrolase-like protein with peptidoglycan-binding domain